MFSTSSSFKMTICVVVMVMMMMMMVMIEAAAVPQSDRHSKHSKETHKKAPDGAAVEIVPLQINPSVSIGTRVIRSLQNDSISPWTYDYSYDSSLYPPRLAEARCLLNGCLNSEGKEDGNLESRPIMHEVHLLRRVKSKGAGPDVRSCTNSTTGYSYHYQLEKRLITVGCTCVRPQVQQQQ